MCTTVKIIGCLLAATTVCVLAYFGVRRTNSRSSSRKSDDIDGGVVKRYRADVPKVIKSTEIESFHYEISRFAACEADGLGHRFYTLHAELSDSKVLVSYKWRERGGESYETEYTADMNFTVRLNKIVTAYDFAKHNGYYHKVSGLPDMYGEILDITYVGGEHIYVYDNQDCFLPLEAEKELVSLFCAATKSDNESFF